MPTILILGEGDDARALARLLTDRLGPRGGGLTVQVGTEADAQAEYARKDDYARMRLRLQALDEHPHPLADPQTCDPYGRRRMSKGDKHRNRRNRYR